MMRSPSFVQHRPPPLRPDSSQHDHHDDDRRPRSSDAKSDSYLSGIDNRARSQYSAEPGEITVKSERESQSARVSMDRDIRTSRDANRGGPGPSPTIESVAKFPRGPTERADESNQAQKDTPKRKRRGPHIAVVRFELPPKTAPPEQNSESDDDDDMADYFAMEIEKTEAELAKLEKPKLPTEVMARFAALSHGSMVKILSEGEGLMEMMGPLSEIVVQLDEEVEEAKEIKEVKETVEIKEVEQVTETVEIKEAEPAQIVKEVKELSSTVQRPNMDLDEQKMDIDIEMTDVPDSPKVPEEIEGPPKEPEKKLEEISEKESEELVEKQLEKQLETQSETQSETQLEKQLEKQLETQLEEQLEKHPERQPEKPLENQPENDTGKQLETQPGHEIGKEDAKQSEKQPTMEPEHAAEKASETALAKESEPIPTVEKVEEPVKEIAKETVTETIKETVKKPANELVNEPVNEPVKEPAAPPLEPKTEEMEIDTPTAAVPPTPDNAIPTLEVSSKGDAVQKLTPAPEAELAKPLETPQEKPADNALNVPLETTEVASKPPSTPSQVDDDETESEDDSYMNIDTVRQYMATPPIDSLPDYSCMPWDKDRDFLNTLHSDSIIDEYVIEQLDKISLEKTTEQDSERKIYADNYEHYLKFTASNDPAAVKSRGKFSVSTAVEVPGTVTPEQKHEGSGRGRRFATERDLERVLQASMREDEERRERELRAQKEKYRTEKEAIIPDMIWTEEDKDNIQYLDQSGFTPPERLVSAWRVLPPVNNFTEEECGLFEKRYLEAPKQWGRIAEAVPHRDFGSCIQYYYMRKKELNLKEKLKKQPKRRKKGGRGKQRSSALVSELGNGEPEAEENHETGENGERRRPRRAAAPTWGFEQPPVDTENSTPSGTPGRRGNSAAAKGDGEKVDGRKGRRKAAKDKEPKAPKVNQTLAAAPAAGTGKGRSRSNSRALNVEPQQPPPPPEVARMPTQFEQPSSIIQPPFPVQPSQQPPVQPLERAPPIVSTISEVMAAPSLRPEPPPQPAMTTFNLAQPQQERKAPTQASSYWSVSESNDFPHLLRAFGSDWTAIAAHMGSKTAVMVC